MTFTTPKAPAPAPPSLGKSFTGSATGLVLIEINGKFVPITELSKIPNGAIINALHGTLTLNTAAIGGTQHATLAAKKGKKKPKKPQTQTGKFGGAVFKVTQTHSGQATLALVEGAKFKGAPTYASCTTKKGKAVAAGVSSKTLQLLHASAHGQVPDQGPLQRGDDPRHDLDDRRPLRRDARPRHQGHRLRRRPRPAQDDHAAPRPQLPGAGASRQR